MKLDELTIELGNKIDWNTFDLRKCSKCKLCSSRINVVPPKIVPNCKIMFITDAPGYEEDRIGTEPLIGRSGQLFNQCLEQLGIDREKCSIANVVSCKPPNNREPETDEIKACYDILDHYIQKANPEIIVPLGNVAFKRIVKKSGITKHLGHIMESSLYPGRKIVPVVHPSFALRDPKNINQLIFGLTKVKELADGKQMVKVSDYTYVDTYEKFDAMIKDLKSKSYFAMDIEASSFNWDTGFIICISFSNEAGKSYVLPWIIGDENYYAACKKYAPIVTKRDVIDDIDQFCHTYSLKKPKFKWENTDVLEKLKELLADEAIAKILHNYAYDYKFLEKAGLKIGGVVYDTMILHHLLDETYKTHALDYLCLHFTNYGEYWKPLDDYVMSKKTVDKFDTYAIIPLDELVPYAGTDSDVTLQLFNIFYPRIEKEGFLTLYLSFLFPLTKMLMETEKNGMSFDVAYSNEIEKILTQQIAEIDVKLLEYTKDIIYDKEEPEKKGINFNSPPQLGYFLYEYLNLPILDYTPTKKPATGYEILEKLQSMHEVPKLLIERKKRTKLLSTYVIGFREWIWKDGKVHPNFLIVGTETGRLSVINPAVQTLPRKDAELSNTGVNIRNLFKVTNEETHYLVEVDYSQAELRLIAEFSRDKNLYNAFLNGRDPHAELALRIYHRDRIADMEAGIIKPMDIVTKEQRQNGKTANFSLVYGKNAENFAIENNIPLAEAIKIWTIYWETYQGIAVWKQMVIQKACLTLEFVSLFGRKRRMQKLQSLDKKFKAEAEREGVNFVIQSQASDYTLYSMLKVTKIARERGYDFATVSFVHDSSVLEVNKNCIQEFLILLHDTMIVCPGISLPMEVEIKVGQRLGSLKEWIKKDNTWAEKPAKAA